MNSTARPLAPAIALLDSGATAGDATAFILKNREDAPNTEVMNSSSDRDAVSVESRRLPPAGKRFTFAFEPYSLTLLEIHLATH